jgi:transposase
MVQDMRRAHGAAFKAKVALEAVKGEKTIAQLSSEAGVHANQIRQWRKQLLEELPRIFSDRRRKEDREREDLVSELYQQIGQLKVELDWLKKKSQLLRWGEKGADRSGAWEAFHSASVWSVRPEPSDVVLPFGAGWEL